MPIEDFIITIYCLIEEKYEFVVKGIKLRRRGPAPALTDVEVLTMMVVGDYLKLGDDKAIWVYFSQHWLGWFPQLGCRTSFIRQWANLLGVYERMHTLFSDQLCSSTDLYLFDGFPIPVCHVKRYKQASPFRGIASVGYCAAKEEHYFGFKAHLLISHHGVTKALSITPANTDERDVLPQVTTALTGDVIADKGLIRPELREELKNQGLYLHTPLRKNMPDPRPKEFISQIMNVRRKVETVIGQLVERFKIQSIRAKDNWHLMAKIGRKIFAHTLCFFANLKLNPDNPLQLERLLT